MSLALGFQTKATAKALNPQRIGATSKLMQKFITDLIRALVTLIVVAVVLCAAIFYLAATAQLLRWSWNFGWLTAERFLQ